MAEEKFINGWPVLDQLGSGAKVTSISSSILIALLLRPRRYTTSTMRQGSAVAQPADKRITWLFALAKGVTELTRPHKPEELGAAERYKIPDGKPGEKALGRLRIEIELLRRNERREQLVDFFVHAGLGLRGS